MDIISYFETFINSDTILDKNQIKKDLKGISDKYFKEMVKIKDMKLPYGGWEFNAKCLRNQWVKAYIIDEGYTFKIYFYNSNEFLKWVATIVMHELAIKYNATVFSGRNLTITRPDNAFYKTFKGYMEELKINGPKDSKQVLIKHTIPRKIRKVFEL